MENKIIRKILEIIDLKQDCNVNCNKIYNNWLITGVDNEIEIEMSIHEDIVIFNTVVLARKRTGTLTEIVDYILSKQLSVVILSVLTPEMYKFCEKNGFELYERELGFGSFLKKPNI